MVQILELSVILKKVVKKIYQINLIFYTLYFQIGKTFIFLYALNIKNIIVIIKY